MFGARFQGSPPCLEQGSAVLWKNPSKRSSTYTRRAFVFRASEGNEGILNFLVPTTDNEKAQISSTSVELINLSGIKFQVNRTVHDKMKYLQLKKKISGIGGLSYALLSKKTG